MSRIRSPRGGGVENTNSGVLIAAGILIAVGVSRLYSLLRRRRSGVDQRHAPSSPSGATSVGGGVQEYATAQGWQPTGDLGADTLAADYPHSMLRNLWAGGGQSVSGTTFSEVYTGALGG